MIKANELRIGNWVQDEQGIIQYVYRLWKGGAELAEDENGGDDLDYTEDEIFEILITEEWLVKFGFTKVIYDDEQHGYGTEYHLEVSSDIFLNYSDDFSLAIFESKTSMKDSFGIIPKWGSIKTVHGLQNLYFALTGEELTIKN